jgi:hypothetical protein
MSKILKATCQGKVVKFNEAIIEAEILSEGNGESEGALLLEGEKAYYLPSNATDLKETLEKVSEVLGKIGETLTAIGAGMTGPTTAPPPDLAAKVAEINAIASELSTLKEGIK